MTQLTDDCFAFGGKLMPVAEALEILQSRVEAIGETETVALADALGRVLADDLRAEVASPPHDNVAVDGYALRSADLAADADTALEIAGRAAAGHPVSGPMAPGSAVRVFTGAVLPAGADTVVMQEDARLEAGRVVVPPGLKAGANRRLAGEDVGEGAVAIVKGRRIRAQEIGLAAAVGHARLTVHRRLAVGVFSTGDEIREPGAPLPAGAVNDANRHMVMALVRQLPADVVDLGILADDRALVTRRLAEAAAGLDVLITSGGVSTGEEDHVKAAVEASGALHFWRIAIKPGRPLALGTIDGTAFIGLPGNPVAAMICFLRFARPLILKLAGVTDLAPTMFRVAAAFEHVKKPDRREWVRAHLSHDADGSAWAHKFARQGSGIISSLVESDGLVELSEEVTHLHPGTMVDFLPFAEVMR